MPSDKARRHVYWPCFDPDRQSLVARDKAALLQVLYGFNRCQKSSTIGIYLAVPENNLGTSYGIIDT